MPEDISKEEQAKKDAEGQRQLEHATTTGFRPIMREAFLWQPSHKEPDEVS